MPTYQYACTESACGHQFEKVQSFSDTALTTCPICEGRLRKVFSPVGVVFKGSGFYRTDSRAANGSKNGAGKGENAKSGKDSAAAKSDSSAKSSEGGSSDKSSSSDSSSKSTSGSTSGSTSSPKAAAT
ncbi:MAG TPA: FmdB family zinc ribbon protein [Mycobacteriales bacterium]